MPCAISLARCSSTSPDPEASLFLLSNHRSHCSRPVTPHFPKASLTLSHLSHAQAGTSVSMIACHIGSWGEARLTQPFSCQSSSCPGHLGPPCRRPSFSPQPSSLLQGSSLSRSSVPTHSSVSRGHPSPHCLFSSSHQARNKPHRGVKRHCCDI